MGGGDGLRSLRRSNAAAGRETQGRKGVGAAPWGTMGCSQPLKEMAIRGASGSRAREGFPWGKLVEQERWLSFCGRRVPGLHPLEFFACLFFGQAAILQQTAEYIFSLEQEKTRLLQQNAQLKRFIQVGTMEILAGRGALFPVAPAPPLQSGPSWQEFSGSSPKRRRAEDKDEGIGSPDIWEDEKADDLRREMIELRQQLDKERSVRMMLEEQVCPVGLEAGSQEGFCAVYQRTNAPGARGRGEQPEAPSAHKASLAHCGG